MKRWYTVVLYAHDDAGNYPEEYVLSIEATGPVEASNQAVIEVMRRTGLPRHHIELRMVMYTDIRESR